jgi:hypothetical protein
LGAFWSIYKDPGLNTFDSPPAMSGDYFLGSFWLLN